MRIVRRHRRTILVVLSLFALGALSFGYLKRIGCAPSVAPADRTGATAGQR